jgi:hypothetical protein
MPTITGTSATTETKVSVGTWKTSQSWYTSKREDVDYNGNDTGKSRDTNISRNASKSLYMYSKPEKRGS